MPIVHPTDYTYVDYLWKDDVAAQLTPAEGLVYRSNLLGSDQRITNTGGGNTSVKTIERDPLTHLNVEVLWVKGSGGDLRTSTVDNFSSLYQEKLLALQPLYGAADVKGPKTPIEDAMVGYYPHCTFNLNPRPASIDTPLHSFIPARHVDHTHPNAIISIAASRRSKEITKEVFGEEVGWTPWLRPGFELGLEIQRMYQDNPKLRGIVLGQHGLINWADSNRECYELTLTLIERAARYINAHDKKENTFGGCKYQALEEPIREEVLYELLPWLRGQLSRNERRIATVHSDLSTLEFVNSQDAARLANLGTSCPDHFLRTKIKPLYLNWNPETRDVDALREKLTSRLNQYRKDYTNYYNSFRRPDSPAMRDPNPTVVLIPGIGMIAWGKDKSESRVTAEFYHCAVEVMRGAEAIDEYIELPLREAFDIEYWQLEEAKLKRMPPERELARHVALIVGAGSGIGAAIARKVAREGAHVACADINEQAAERTAASIAQLSGPEIGIGGTGISSCGRTIALHADVKDRASVRRMLVDSVLAFGGVDNVVITAGVFPFPDERGRIDDKDWKLTFDVNVIGPWTVVDELQPLWVRQDLAASVVVTTSANAVVAKKGSLAYDTSKAAANHLVRELAVELAPIARVNGVAPATVVSGSTMFPRQRVIASLTKYGIPFDPNEETEPLREKLATFYAQRTLLKVAITPEDQAEAAFFLISARSVRTTGQILAVDGGLTDAFMR
jgi:rhamnulose-1-phosphate aldolase/alcohol dehydrogenase